ncbi:MAG TPA: hypothetical protein VFP68_11905 [Burkholderiaceae bacterium]|nr:hypothetical protein [Burkholderiaceae bacterium]
MTYEFEIPVMQAIERRTGHGRYPVTLVGYGRYGNYIGPKYARCGHPWEIHAVVDPQVSRDAFDQTVLGKLRPHTQLLQTAEAWSQQYFSKLEPSKRSQVVVELALAADKVLEAARQYILAGVKNLILPKPVVDTEEALVELIELVRRHRVKAAVASQWFYSSLPRIVARDLRRLTSGPGAPHPDLDRVVIEFSKENGHGIAPAPLCELPHALQILDCAGLLEGGQRECIDSEPWAVTVKYAVPHVRQGVFAIARMDYERKPSQQHIHTDWDYQERTLKVYGAGPHPLLWADLWIKFSRSGNSIVHAGRYNTLEPDGRVHSHGIAEDMLQQMHEAIFEAFDLPWEQFEASDAALPLSRYSPIGLELTRCHKAWKEANETFASNAA